MQSEDFVSDVPDETGHATFLSQYVDPEPADAIDIAPQARLRSISEFVTALSRAVQAFHTYPPESPIRRDIVEVVREALRSALRGRVGLALNVTNEGLKVEGEFLAGDTGAERALVLALRRNYVSVLKVDAAASTRDIQQFCAVLAFPEKLLDRTEDLPEILDERGVSGIRTQVIAMHQTIEGGSVPPALLTLVQEGQAGANPSREQAERGWIRIDSSVALDRVAIEDLPLLLRDAPSLAVALQQIGGRRRDTVSSSDALVTHYSEITELYAAAAPEVGEALFEKLAGFVQGLPADTKHRLLREQVLPGLIDGTRSGRILRHFADEEVSSALWLLLDLGVGGVEMLSAGIAKLDLPESRLSTIIERVSDRLEDEGSASAAAMGRSLPRTDRAAHLLRAANESGREFLALRSFDLSIDEEASLSLAESVRAIEETDGVAAQVQCFADILALSADTQVAGSVLRKSRGLFQSLEHRGDVVRLAAGMARYADIGGHRETTDPEIAALIREALADYLTPEFIHRVSALAPAPSGELPLVTIICGLKATGVTALIKSLLVESDRSARNRLLTSLAPRAGELVNDLAPHLSNSEWYVVRNVLTLMGHGGRGYEKDIAECLDHDDLRVVREAFLALARIGSREGAERTAAALRHSVAEVRRQAAEALWCYPPEVSNPLILSALEDPGLVRQSPDLARQLADGATRRGLAGLDPIFRRLRWNLLMIWNPDRRALGWCSLQYLRRAS